MTKRSIILIATAFFSTALPIQRAFAAADNANDAKSPAQKQTAVPSDPTANYEPDWSRFEKAGLFGEVNADKPVTSDEKEDLAAAEAHFEALLNTDLTPGQRMKTLLQMADLYRKNNVRPKEAAVYERYIEAFPQDMMAPEIYMRLGFIYRDLGAFKTALSKFYAVLNSSLSVTKGGMDAYRKLSLRAQMEIADTYYLMGDYDQAAKFFMRLKRIDMTRDEHIIVDFKYAYTQYLIKDYSSTISNFQAFIQAYPDNSLVPEAHFILASAFKSINQPRSALGEVLNLLQYQEARKEDEATWNYWKRRTGNQLGNEFYEQGDYESALYIYQAMAKMGDDPNWLWPSLYQMGLCFERLRLTTKAIDSYNLIIDGADAVTKNGGKLPQALSDLLEQVKWRKEHLNWDDETQRQIQQIMGK